MRFVGVIALSLCLATTAVAALKQRETGLDVPSVQTIDALRPCIEGRLAGDFAEVPMPNGGLSIQYPAPRGIIFKAQPFLFFDLTDDGTNRHITVGYRHPFSKKAAARELRSMGHKCFPYELDAAGGGKL